MVKIFKTFYIKYPHLKWFTFRDMRNMPMKKFAENLSECCISVWVDDISGFGTFPVESIKCNVPVLGKVPNMVPEWMEDKNGLWTHDLNAIPDILANYVQAWLEDASPEELYEKMGEMAQKYTDEQQKQKIEEVYSTLMNNRVNEFNEKLESLTLVNNEQQ
jgi:glycosyltransferase involved in cell wall biosynthesis